MYSKGFLSFLSSFLFFFSPFHQRGSPGRTEETKTRRRTPFNERRRKKEEEGSFLSPFLSNFPLSPSHQFPSLLPFFFLFYDSPPLSFPQEARRLAKEKKEVTLPFALSSYIISSLTPLLPLEIMKKIPNNISP